MKTRLLLNLVLLCIVGALILVVVFEPGKDKPKANPLTRIEESRIDTVTLQGQEAIVFERKNGHWWLKSPFAAPANDIRVRQLIDIARAESDAQYPLKPEELSKFELEKPKATLTLGETTLRFGGSDPIDMRRYVQIGDTLHLVRDDFFHHLTAKATDYVDKKLLPDEARITSIAGPGFKASLTQDGKWTMDPPSADSSANAAALLSAWQSARAIDVKRSETASPGDILRIGLADGVAVEFGVLRREPELVLVRSDWGLQYELVGDLAKQLLNQKIAEDDAAKPAEDHAHPPAAGPADQDGEHGAADEEADERQLAPDTDLGEGEDDAEQNEPSDNGEEEME